MARLWKAYFKCESCKFIRDDVTYVIQCYTTVVYYRLDWKEENQNIELSLSVRLSFVFRIKLFPFSKLLNVRDTKV